MNPNLSLTKPYPFARLRELLGHSNPPEGLHHISLSIGEPKHVTPQFIKDALCDNLAELAKYPATIGMPLLRETIADWINRRYGVCLDPTTQIIPTNGSREALFSFVQAVVDSSKPARVVMPCPFYQIYEGAAFLAGATPQYLPVTQQTNYLMDFSSMKEKELSETQVVFVCSPSNPTGKVMGLAEWKNLLELADRYDFVIASDECYSEIYFDESQPPLGALEACRLLGRHNFSRVVVFSSLSKRSNVPGLRSGFVAGDPCILKPYLLYRTYQGCAMGGAVQIASIAAWKDEEHVKLNRKMYAEKFSAAQPLIAKNLVAPMPDASFYLWAQTPIDDKEYARQLYEKQGITVLPGSFLSRDIHGMNPGTNHIRIALVATTEEVREAAKRIAAFHPE